MAIEQAFDKLADIEIGFNTIRDSVSKIKKMTLPDAASEYVKIKELHDAYDEIGKILSETVTLLKGEVLPGMFDRDGLTSFNTKDGYRVTVSMMTRCNMTDKINGMRWLRENGLSDIVTETVNASTLAATARTMLEDGKELEPLYFNTHLMPSTSVTKIKKKE